MNYELGYGKGIQKIEIPDANLMGVLLPENAAAERSEDQEVLRALEEPETARNNTARRKDRHSDQRYNPPNAYGEGDAGAAG